MQKKLLFAFFYVSLAQGYTLHMGVGPGVEFDYLRLIPQLVMSESLIVGANEQSSWNLFSFANAKVATQFRKYIIGSVELEGEWLRNGQAIITDTQAIFLTGLSAERHVTVSANAYALNIRGGLSIPLIPDLSIKLVPGYFFTNKTESLKFIDQPLLFHVYSRFKGPLFQVGFTKKQGCISFDIDYTAIFGTLCMRLTQTPPGPTVVRPLPKTLKSILSISLGYEYNDTLSFHQTLLYSNLATHKIGTSYVYTMGKLQSVTKNVASVQVKSLKWLFELEYKF